MTIELVKAILLSAGALLIVVWSIGTIWIAYQDGMRKWRMRHHVGKSEDVTDDRPGMYR